MINNKNDIIYTFKKSYHISYNKDYFCCVGSNVCLYDLKDGKLVSEFKNIKHPSGSVFTSNQKLVVKTTTGSYYIYDLDTMTLNKKIPPPKGVKGSITDFQITSDNKYIIDFSYVFPTRELMLIEIETGAYTFFNLGYCRLGYVFLTETESKFYVIASCAETIDAPDVSIKDIYELSYNSGEFKLQKLFTDNEANVLIADYVSNKFAISDRSNKIRLFDINKKHQEVLEYNRDGVLYDLKLSKSGKLAALAESRNVYIYDIIKKECIKSYEVDYGCFVDFFDNDTKLLIGTWEKGYCVSIEGTVRNQRKK